MHRPGKRGDKASIRIGEVECATDLREGDGDGRFSSKLLRKLCNLGFRIKPQPKTEHLLTNSPSAAWMSTAVKLPTAISANPFPLLD